MPTWRWSRTACCAAAIDFGRPSVIGSTSPGNSTVLRTGTMISASAGNGGEAPLAARPAFGAFRLQPRFGPAFCNVITRQPVDDGAAHRAVAPGRQPHPPVEPALRQLQPMNDRGAQFRRIGARSGDDEIAVLDHRLRAVGVDAGQRDQRQHLELGFQNVDRRLPGRQARLRAGGLKRSRCMRSARASISHASDHIQSRAKSRAICVPSSLVWICVQPRRAIQRQAGMSIPGSSTSAEPAIHKPGTALRPVPQETHFAVFSIAIRPKEKTDEHERWHARPLQCVDPQTTKRPLSSMRTCWASRTALGRSSISPAPGSTARAMPCCTSTTSRKPTSNSTPIQASSITLRSAAAASRR